MYGAVQQKRNLEGLIMERYELNDSDKRLIGIAISAGERDCDTIVPVHDKRLS